MELWIRSQIGYTLTKCTMLELDNDKTGIFAYNGDSHMVLVGKYKTQERAMQVLDEIQNILQPRVYVKAPSIVNPKDMIEDLTNGICLHTTQQVEMELKQVGQFVYQMPKE